MGGLGNVKKDGGLIDCGAEDCRFISLEQIALAEASTECRRLIDLITIEWLQTLRIPADKFNFCGLQCHCGRVGLSIAKPALYRANVFPSLIAESS